MTTQQQDAKGLGHRELNPGHKRAIIYLTVLYSATILWPIDIDISKDIKYVQTELLLKRKAICLKSQTSVFIVWLHSHIFIQIVLPNHVQ